MHDTDHSTSATHRLFVLTIVGKGLLGVFQLAAAIAIYLGVLRHVPEVVQWFVASGLTDGPYDVLATYILDQLAGVSASETRFYITYFAAHGALHVGVVAAILWGAKWANTAAVVVLWGFVVFQMWEWFSAGGWMLLVLTAIDLVVIFLTLAENRANRAKQDAEALA